MLWFVLLLLLVVVVAARDAAGVATMAASPVGPGDLPGLFAGTALVVGTLPVAVCLLARRVRPVWARVALRVLALVGVVAWALPAGPSPRASARGAGAQDELVVLVTLDTFRADHLGVLGGPVATPHLDALASRGTFLPRVAAPVPLTLPAHVAMFTGRDPWDVGVASNHTPLGPDVPYLPADLKRAGWSTAAFVSAASVARRQGLARGFDHFDDALSWREILRLTRWGRVLGVRSRASERDSGVTVARALTWLRATHGRRFVWVHLFAPHAPYDPPTAYTGEAQVLAWPDDMPVVERMLLPRDPGMEVAAYRGEIAYTDDLVGRLVAALPADAHLVVAIDHGEGLVDRAPYFSHGSDVWQRSIQAPVMAVGPGILPSRQDGARPLTVVHRLLREAAGLPVAREAGDVVAVASRSSSRLAPPTTKAPPVAFLEGAQKWVVAGRRVVRFDLDADPLERSPVEDDRPDLVARAATLRARVDGASTEVGDGGLEALGYVAPPSP